MLSDENFVPTKNFVQRKFLSKQKFSNNNFFLSLREQTLKFNQTKQNQQLIQSTLKEETFPRNKIREI